MAIPALLVGVLILFVLVKRVRVNEPRSGMTILGRLALFVLALLLLGGCAGVNALARNRALAVVFPAHASVREKPEAYGITGYRAVRFPTPDGLELGGWYVPGSNGAAIIVLHGFGGTRDDLLPEAALLYEQGFGLLMYDARSSGESNGRLNSFGLYEVNDVRGAVAFLQAQPGVDPRRIGMLGHSEGAATAVLAGAQIPELQAIAAECAFASVENIINSGVENVVGLPAWLFGPLILRWGEWESGLAMDAVRPVDHVGRISPRPLLLIYGELDDIVLLEENARPMYAAAGEPKRLVTLPRAGHGDLLASGGEAFVQALVGFFQDYLLEK
jgi:uncharacterized protein